jgi:predicted oxidoreductase
MHGKRSLEGTFLGGCVFSGRIAARTIAQADDRAAHASEPAAR